MIGVSASSADLPAVEEFFELFKTPWERAVTRKHYKVVLSAGGEIENLDADHFIVYGSAETPSDRAAAVAVEQLAGPTVIEWERSTFPVYRRLARFHAAKGHPVLVSCGEAVDCRYRADGRSVHRIGYDLFSEIHYLLTEGQPVRQALTPTLELHIALLRHLMLESGMSVVEIPAHPHGYDFICCLTHDVDFFGVRRHKFDRTIAGFAARASVGTLIDLVRRRRSLSEAIRNWLALFSLPLVFLKLLPDFWNPFRHYAQVEDGQRSTFFLVPFKGRPGLGPDGNTNANRAVRYDVDEIRSDASEAVQRGSELAVHGIEAWRDSDAGRDELNQVTAVTGRKTAGVRMHWLYFGEDSPKRLEAAGYDYDSSWGYNDAVGYRAGTSQVFRLLGSDGLMELPLSIMDSAMFYPSRMGLTPQKASQLCGQIVANARRFGGTVVVNWHDRSLAPERQWGVAYQDLLDEVSEGGLAWFARASDAVDWFRWRRSFRYTSETNSHGVTLQALSPCPAPRAAVVQIHRPPEASGPTVEELRFDGREAVRLKL